jgi:glycosyltransferase involved in cell wall biosynthesis
VTGFLVPRGDAGAMAARLGDYVDQPALAAAHGQAGLARIQERFSLAAMMAAYSRVYDALL